MKTGLIVPLNKKSKYHDLNLCIKCGEDNDVVVKDNIEMHISEAETECTFCDHKDHWAYGFFMSTSEPEEKRQVR